jgi:hypothetical protein
MTSLIVLAEDDLAAGWKWVQAEASALYHAVAPLAARTLKAFEQAVVEGLWGAAASLVRRLPAIASLADLETALLNTLSGLGGAFLAAAEAVGSALLQSILGLLQAQARPVAA